MNKTTPRAHHGRGEPGWPWSSANPAVAEESRTVLVDEPPRGRLANLAPHPLFLNRYRVLANELAQAEREFLEAGYPDLAASATAARQAVQELWKATCGVEEAEEREIKRAER